MPNIGEIRKAIAAAVPALRGFEALDAAAAGIVLDEGPAEGPVFLDAAAAAGLGPGPDSLCPHPDDYRGLRLDLYNKSLRLVRGR